MRTSLKFGLIGLITNVLLNGMLFELGLSLDWISEKGPILWDGTPFGLHHVVIATLIPCTVAPVLFLGLQKFSGNAIRAFHILSIMVLMGSFFSPFSIPGLTGKVILLLELMHITTAGLTIWFVSVRPFSEQPVVGQSIKIQYNPILKPKSKPIPEADQVG